ncbi:hypothetical protein HDU67_010197 [Dinochytrium kinnereticum]|nr:hypothetical protein HDU67_010197 [Dinochytrium kinnereticum]
MPLTEMEPALWAVASIVASYMFMIKIPTLSRVYLSAGIHAAKKANPELLRPAMPFLTMVLSAQADESKLERLAETNKMAFEKKGDMLGMQSLSSTLSYLRHPKSYEEVENLFLSRLDLILYMNALTDHNTFSLGLMFSITMKRVDAITFFMDQLESYKKRIVEQYEGFPETSESPPTAGRVWRAVIKNDVEDAINNLAFLAKCSRNLRFLSFLYITVQFGFLAGWPILSLIDSNPMASIKIPAQRKALLDCFRVSAPMFRAFAKGVYRSRIYMKLFEALEAILLGNRRRARKRLRSLLTPQMVGFLQQRNPIWLGTAHAGLWLLDGLQAHMKLARNYFEAVDARTFLDWVDASRPLRHFK